MPPRSTSKTKRKLPSEPTKTCRSPSSVATPFFGCPCLKKAHELPSWQTPRPHILSGYRVGYSPVQALISFFTLHNETGNVMTHFIPFWILLPCVVHLYSAVIADIWHHQALFLVFVIANFMVFFFSTMYHLMSCVSHKWYTTTMFLDYFSISSLLVTSFIPSIYFAFACHFWERLIYLGMISILGSISLILPWFNFFDQKWFSPYRVAIYSLTGASGLVPAIHSMIVFPIDFSLMHPSHSIPINPSNIIHVGVSLMFLFYAAGIMFYLSKFPESWFPGRFDLSLCMSSHSLWHICVACAAIIHFFTCMGIYQRFSTIGECPA
jgi:adiponectin receptor